MFHPPLQQLGFQGIGDKLTSVYQDAALLLIAGNETCPQPQTSEHLAAIEIMKLNHIVILQNKGKVIFLANCR